MLCGVFRLNSQVHYVHFHGAYFFFPLSFHHQLAVVSAMSFMSTLALPSPFDLIVDHLTSETVELQGVANSDEDDASSSSSSNGEDNYSEDEEPEEVVLAVRHNLRKGKVNQLPPTVFMQCILHHCRSFTRPCFSDTTIVPLHGGIRTSEWTRLDL